MTPYAIPRLTRSEIDLLRRLRSVFLEEPVTGSTDYWSSEATLSLYDATFGRRIAWKWEAVCGELQRRGWTLPDAVKALVDWGCGSGVASEIFLNQKDIGVDRVQALVASDRSALAMHHVTQKVRGTHPHVATTSSASLSSSFFLVSHVLTELPEAALDALLGQISQSAGVLWVEPGSHLCSHRLAQVHDRLLGEFRVVAPCTHPSPCPLRDPINARHWCHTFATPPRKIFHNSEWSHFATEFGVDLRSLPVAFLCMERGEASSSADLRVLGRPRHFKGRARIQVCGPRGLSEHDIPFKSHKALIKDLDNAEFEALITEELP